MKFHLGRVESLAAVRVAVDELKDSQGWMALGRCAETDPDAYFPENKESDKFAKRVCAECIVKPECLDYSFVNRVPEGVWGGVDQYQRAKLLGVAIELVKLIPEQEISQL